MTDAQACCLAPSHGAQEAVGVLSAPGSAQRQVGDALEALRYLVEPIDAANGESGCVGGGTAERVCRVVCNQLKPDRGDVYGERVCVRSRRGNCNVDQGCGAEFRRVRLLRACVARRRAR